MLSIETGYQKLSHVLPVNFFTWAWPNSLVIWAHACRRCPPANTGVTYYHFYKIQSCASFHYTLLTLIKIISNELTESVVLITNLLVYFAGKKNAFVGFFSLCSWSFLLFIDSDISPPFLHNLDKSNFRRAFVRGAQVHPWPIQLWKNIMFIY